MNESWIKWAENVHNTLYAKISETRETMKSLSPEELVDIGWVLKKMYENLDDIRKEVDKLKGYTERLTCLRCVEEDTGEIHGKLAKATPDVKVSARLPHPEKSPEEWAKLCEYLGVPSEIGKNDLMRFHWPGLKEFVTEELAKGKESTHRYGKDFYPLLSQVSRQKEMNHTRLFKNLGKILKLLHHADLSKGEARKLLVDNVDVGDIIFCVDMLDDLIAEVLT